MGNGETRDQGRGLDSATESVPGRAGRAPQRNRVQQVKFMRSRNNPPRRRLITSNSLSSGALIVGNGGS
jgi:hypothetical protein